MKILRVFPRRTNATPTDSLVYINRPPDMLVPEIDEVHISVAFTYDMRQADRLMTWWSAVGVPVRVGGPAYGDPSGEFIPGRYVKQGYTITSRGCPNKCWFCSVWRREPELIELEVKDGWNILDDNLLACSDSHVKAVFEMLSRQTHPAVFSGGLEAARLKPWHCEDLKKLKPERMYFAYDTPDDLEPLFEAGKMLRAAGFTAASHDLKCYVLAGYDKDTPAAAEQRLYQAIDAGFMPYIMLYKNQDGIVKSEWRKFADGWDRAQIVGLKMRERMEAMR
jgi:hypothetical protein